MKEIVLGCLFIGLATVSFAQQEVTLSGYIKDVTNGEELIGATIFIEELSTGVTANVYGFYSISIPKGTYTIKISYLGYDAYSEQININADKAKNFELKQDAISLKTFVISDKNQTENLENTEMGVIRMDMKSVKKIPALMGENDVLRTVQLLPGVQSGGEANTGFFVRGGNSDQNLILLDDAPVYNPSHLLGIFSAFNSNSIKDLKLYKGGIPAKYGGRLSSLLDIKMKEGNLKKLEGTASISPLSSNLTIEAPIIKDKSSFIVSGRRSYLDLFTKLSADSNLRNSQLYFYDFNAKANYIINENNRIFISGYFGKDVLGLSKNFSTDWGNQTGTIRWNHIFNSDLFLSNTFYASTYKYKLRINDNIENITYDSKIANYGGRSDFTYYLNPKNTIKFGLATARYEIEPGTYRGTNTAPVIVPSNSAWEHATYISNDQKIGNKLAVEYGVRFSLFQNVGKATIFEYDKTNPAIYTVKDSSVYSSGVFNTYTSFEPRMSLRYTLNSFSSIKASYNRTSQFIHQASNATASSPLTVWLPSSPNIKPQFADQYAVGYFRNFLDNMLETSVEAYYKDMRNTIDFRDNAELQLNKYLDGELRFGKSYSYGIEVLVRKNHGKLTGWIGYTWSVTKRKIPEINNGKEFFAPYDRTHDVSVIAIYELNKRTTLSGNWLYSTGPAVTVPTGKYAIQGTEVPVYSDRNTARIPAYHRLDLSMTLKGRTPEEKGPRKNGKDRWKIASEWTFSIMNVYYRKNPYTIRFNENESTGRTEASKTYFFPILPSVAYSIKF